MVKQDKKILKKIEKKMDKAIQRGNTEKFFEHLTVYNAELIRIDIDAEILTKLLKESNK